MSQVLFVLWIRVGLALLHIMQPQILDADCEQILQVVQSSRQSIFGMNSRSKRERPLGQEREGPLGQERDHLSYRKRFIIGDVSKESHIRIQYQKRVILMKSQQFKIRSSDLEFLETRFEIRKLEVRIEITFN